MRLDELRGKKIVFAGMGVNNRGLADYLAKQKIAYDVIEGWKDPHELAEKFDKYDVVFRAPGLPFLSQPIQDAVKKGILVSSQTKLFFELCQATIIGVTGTKGKGTTASLLAKILALAGKKVWLCGNIGRDPFEFFDQIKPADFVVMELSSFQLQDLKQSPHVAVVLNITSDHLNHHKSLEEYVLAKTSIVKYQKESDFAVLHPSLPEKFKNLGLGKKVYFDPQTARGYQTRLLGSHNLENIAAAATATGLLGINDDTIGKSVSEFEPLPHRLKVLKEVRDIIYIDDGFSTNTGPTIAAIEAMTSPFSLIIGGFDKGLDFSPVGKAILDSPNIKGLVVIGQMTEQILKAVFGFKGKILTGAKNMREILSQANSLAKPGDTILFSPGTSSFDMFKNETDRGEQFVSAVNQL